MTPAEINQLSHPGAPQNFSFFMSRVVWHPVSADYLPKRNQFGGSGFGSHYTLILHLLVDRSSSCLMCGRVCEGVSLGAYLQGVFKGFGVELSNL